MTGIGHNGYPSFDTVVEENLTVGLYLAQRDALARAICDPTLTHRHRVVLAYIVVLTNADTGDCAPGRANLARATGYTEGTIGVTISELSDRGYVYTRRRAPDGGGHPLAHYAVRKPSREEVEAAIMAHVTQIKKEAERARNVKALRINVNSSNVNGHGVNVNGPDVNGLGINVNGGQEPQNEADVNGQGVNVNPPLNVNPVVNVNGQSINVNGLARARVSNNNIYNNNNTSLERITLEAPTLEATSLEYRFPQNSEISPVVKKNDAGVNVVGDAGIGDLFGLDAQPQAVAAKPDKKQPRVDADFERFWAVYPRKVAKRDAVSAYVKARKSVDAATIQTGVERYVASNPEPKYTPYPATWLNRGQWEDDAGGSTTPSGQTSESRVRSFFETPVGKEMRSRLGLEAATARYLELLRTTKADDEVLQ